MTCDSAYRLQSYAWSRPNVVSVLIGYRFLEWFIYHLFGEWRLSQINPTQRPEIFVPPYRQCTEDDIMFSLCPSCCLDVRCLVRRAGESITHMQRRRHHMTARGLKLSVHSTVNRCIVTFLMIAPYKYSYLLTYLLWSFDSHRVNVLTDCPEKRIACLSPTPAVKVSDTFLFLVAIHSYTNKTLWEV